ncbi:MAG: cyanophycin synthetase [Myxococcota bacterium]|jgi:cyanophycin synthetase|nr:cyanophycin synthetase [Myxococcota bacterium]
MEVSKIRALRGPNLWTSRTALEALITLSEDERALSGIAKFENRLQERYPSLVPGWPARIPEETQSLAHMLECVAMALQVQAGCSVSFSRTASTLQPGIYKMVVEYKEEAVGRRALELAQQLVGAATRREPFDAVAALRELHALDEDIRLGPSTNAIVSAAVERGIPVRRLNDASLVQLGWGKKQRRILAAETDSTSAISESIAQDKELTKSLLYAVGVPVPLGRTVMTAEEAWAAASELGFPVVIKPRYGSKGRGVTVNLSTKPQIVAAFSAARQINRAVLVEQCLLGRDHRLLVVGDQLVAAARRDPATVMGDGVHTIRQLVSHLNEDPRRGDGHATPLTRVPLDDIAFNMLASQGCDEETVLPPGVEVVMRSNANLSTGGTATDVTDEVHPTIARRAIEAAQAVGLDVCGVDVLCERIDLPLEDQRAGVVEVNAAPGLRMHLSPSVGKSRAVGKAIIAKIFQDEDNGRIPVVAVAGTNGKTTTTRLVAHLLAQSGKTVGMTCSDGIYIDGKRIETGDCSGPKSGRAVLAHPDVQAAVLETARGGILREGLAFDRCDVAIVTNLGSGDHLGLSFITSVQDLAVVKRVIVQNVAQNGTAVLNAADPLVADMASSCPGNVVFFAQDESAPVLAAQKKDMGRVVYVNGGDIVVAENGWKRRIPLSEIPLTRGGTVLFQVENALAAVAAAWSLGLDFELIRAGLRTFESDVRTAPGRFNVMKHRGATIIADYGHNPDAIAALVQAVETMPATRRIAVISGAGDRRDIDILRQTQILGEAFDEVLLYQDQCQRGRADGEVLALLRMGLEGAKRAVSICEIRGEMLAIDTCLEHLSPGDLALVLVDQIDEALAHLEQRLAEGRSPQE